MALFGEIDLITRVAQLLAEEEKDRCKENEEISCHDDKEQSVETDHSYDAADNLADLELYFTNLSPVQFPESLRSKIESIDFFGAAQRNKEALFRRHRSWQ